MKDLSIGDRVIVIEDHHTIKKGTIKSTYHDLYMFIVEYDDGSVGKVSGERIAYEPKADPEVGEMHEDAPRISEITITADAFIKLSSSVLLDYLIGENKTTQFSEIFDFLVELYKALFYTKESENSDNDK